MFREVRNDLFGDPELTSWVPVSYTHLDVYKRQVVNWSLETPVLLMDLISKEDGLNAGYASLAIFAIIPATPALENPRSNKMCIRDRLYTEAKKDYI